MDIVDGLKLVARWWFVTIPVVIVSIVAAFVVTTGVQPEYTAEGSVLFLGPSVQAPAAEGDEPTVVNPLLDGSSGLATVAEITTLAINNAEVAQLLADEGLSPEFAVGSTSRSPILLVEASAHSRATATETALRVTELIELDLELRQDSAGVPEEQRVSTEVVSLSAVGGADYGGRTRIRIAVVGLGIGLAASAAFVLESLRRRRQAADETDTGDPDNSSAPSDGIGRRSWWRTFLGIGDGGDEPAVAVADDADDVKAEPTTTVPGDDGADDGGGAEVEVGAGGRTNAD